MAQMMGTLFLHVISFVFFESNTSVLESESTGNLMINTSDDKVFKIEEEEKELSPAAEWLKQNQRHLIRCLAIIVTIGFLIAAVTVRGRAGKVDCIVLGLVSAGIVLFNINPYLDGILKPEYFEPLGILAERLSVLGKRKWSLVAMGVVILIIIAVVFALPIDPAATRLSRAQALLGFVVFLGLLYITSHDRKAVEWRTIWVGILMQFLLALFVLRTWIGFHIFKYISDLFADYLGFSQAGYSFLFGSNGSAFASEVFPAIIFFCATVEVLYYLGALQAIIRKFAVFFRYLMGISGAEAIVAAASPFIGQGENALFVRPFVKDMTKSEIHQIMASGFATISGSSLFGYISLGMPPEYLITAAIMSVPCAISLSKLRYPETQVPLTKGKISEIPTDERHQYNNILQAFGSGAKTGIKIVLIIGASLVAVLSLLAAINAILTWLGRFFFIHTLTIQKILSYPLYIVTWLMGVEWAEVPKASELLALKVAANEFAAYSEFAPIKATLTQRTQVIITYALCGFGNFSSIGIQIGILSALAPTRMDDIASLAFSAMVTGVFSSCFCALTAGMLV
eukprot:Phypoly_transcript_05860.p1 GENE.Phypoly_transcript_05860~~Phypoly_transcript_05860.p1  ORF type:complete len:569 (+),score=54.39 Phypoly_transcript_05860:141-1847(+)